MKQLDHLKALAAEYEEKARAIRITIGLLSQNGHAAALDALPGKLRKAIKAEANGHGGARQRAGRPKRYPGNENKTRRGLTAWVWAAFGTEPQTIADAAITLDKTPQEIGQIVGSLIRYGYLKKVDNGYVHTAKAYEA